MKIFYSNFHTKLKWPQIFSEGAPVGSTSSTDASVNVEGSLSNTKLSQIPWFPSDGKLSLPVNTLATNNIEGVTANDINNRFLALGLNKPNIGHGQCRAPGNSAGSCRHLHHCVKPVFFNIINFFVHMCIIEGRYNNSFYLYHLQPNTSQIHWSLLSRRYNNNHFNYNNPNSSSNINNSFSNITHISSTN